MDPRSAQLWWPGLGAVRLASLGAVAYARWDRQTDRRIAASLNAPYRPYSGGSGVTVSLGARLDLVGGPTSTFS